MLPHQLGRCARRTALGVGRGGAVSGHGSGDIFIAFSTANPGALDAGPEALAHASFVPDAALNPLFAAVIEAVDEAILNALVGERRHDRRRDGRFVPALPHGELRRLLRLSGPGGS